MRAATISLCLVACTGVTTLRYRPSRSSSSSTISVDHGRSSLPQPPRGEAIAATLADGFPVWVVHHDDETITVVSGVAPARAQPGGFSRDAISTQVDRSLVAWIPGVRRFSAGGILYDELGHALGFTDFDACMDDCPTIDSKPTMLRDLDTVSTDGKLVEGTMRSRAATWLPWRRLATRETREADMTAANSPAIVKRSLADALHLPDGQFAIVDGETVRSTHADPVICTSTKTCGACGTEKLPLADITASDAAHLHREGWWRDPADYRKSRNATYIESQPGTFLVRRQGAGFQIVAGIFRGICSGTW